MVGTLLGLISMTVYLEVLYVPYLTYQVMYVYYVCMYVCMYVYTLSRVVVVVVATKVRTDRLFD